MKRQPYPSDLTDKAWAILEPLIPPPAPGDRPRKTDMRQVADAIFYRDRDGCTRRAPPHDFPPWRTVYNYFKWWKWDGTWRRIDDALRPQVRIQAGRQPTPRAGPIDSQTVKATEVGGPHGFDGAKLITGRERHIVVGTLGLLPAVVVTSASADDGAAAPSALGKLSREALPRLALLWADNKHRNHALDRWVSEHGWYVIRVRSRPPGSEGFVLLKRR